VEPFGFAESAHRALTERGKIGGTLRLPAAMLAWHIPPSGVEIARPLNSPSQLTMIRICTILGVVGRQHFFILKLGMQMIYELTKEEAKLVSGAGLAGTIAGTVAGTIAGNACGAGVGAAIGAAAGSVIPGFGTLGGALIGAGLGMRYGGLIGGSGGGYIFNGIQDHGLAFLFPNGLPHGTTFEDLWNLTDVIESYR
jgi:hypothetical protein